MNLPIKWLQEYIEVNDTKTLANRLTMSGTKVEALHKRDEEISSLVIGKITDIQPHPRADLAVTMVNVGNKEYQIICGAKNINKNDIVAVVLPGETLPGLKIFQREIRGVVSNGMICSVEELGYTRQDFPHQDEGGVYIFQEEYPLGSDACEALELKQEVLELELTPNRPDCNSVLGIARECAALGYKKTHFFEALEIQNDIQNIETKTTNSVKVTVNDPHLCKRYIAQVVNQVKIAPSPQWLRRRLTESGLRPINNIVDITNYVMLEYGQPLHAFDINFVADKEIIVRTAKDGEKITTLDNTERKLKSTHLLITDPEKPLAIAGVMGGLNSGITEATTTVIFESANFDGISIRTTSRDLGLRTDSSAKFEKGIDPELALASINRCMELIKELGCGVPEEGLVDVYPVKNTGHTIEYPRDKINNLLGTNIPSDEMDKILNSLDISTEKNTAFAPGYRKDLQTWEDLAEEVIRIYGFEKLSALMDNVSSLGRKTQNIDNILTATLTALGLREILTYSFENPKVFNTLDIPVGHTLRNALGINNPQGDYSIMKTTLLGGMLSALALNYNRRNKEAYLFERANVYLGTRSKPLEEEHVQIGVYAENADFYYIKGMIEAVLTALGISAEYQNTDEHNYLHLGRKADIVYNREILGYVGQVSPVVCENYGIKEQVYTADLNISLIKTQANLTKTYEPLPKYPSVSRDLAIKIPVTISAGQAESAIKSAAGLLLESVELFDLYQGEQIKEGYKSLAFSLSFRDKNSTLEDKQILPVMEKIMESLKALGGEIRQ